MLIVDNQLVVFVLMCFCNIKFYTMMCFCRVVKIPTSEMFTIILDFHI